VGNEKHVSEGKRQVKLEMEKKPFFSFEYCWLDLKKSNAFERAQTGWERQLG
jgi:hypothetical protein